MQTVTHLHLDTALLEKNTHCLCTTLDVFFCAEGVASGVCKAVDPKKDKHRRDERTPQLEFLSSSFNSITFDVDF